jgi:hypothetical protein
MKLPFPLAMTPEYPLPMEAVTTVISNDYKMIFSHYHTLLSGINLVEIKSKPCLTQLGYVLASQLTGI